MQRPYKIKSYNSYKKSSPKLRISGHPNLARLIATENSYFKCMFIKKAFFWKSSTIQAQSQRNINAIYPFMIVIKSFYKLKFFVWPSRNSS